MDRWSTTDWIDPLNLFDRLHCWSSRLNVLSRCIRSNISINQIGWIDFSHQIDQVNSLDQIEGVDLFNHMHRSSRSNEQNFQRLIYDCWFATSSIFASRSIILNIRMGQLFSSAGIQSAARRSFFKGQGRSRVALLILPTSSLPRQIIACPTS